MIAMLLAQGSAYWHVLPLVVVVSLVYRATRHEEWPLILRRAVRDVVFILSFMFAILLVLWAIQLL